MFVSPQEHYVMYVANDPFASRGENARGSDHLAHPYQTTSPGGTCHLMGPYNLLHKKNTLGLIQTV